ncbi:hypothetical protein [Bacillus cereus]|uniref:hypothetical protein n=1 Tax=Bacillus cereus TaxID=1396 RepID=UPI003D16FBEE
MISIEFFGDSQDELFNPELKRVLELIETCSSRFILPESLNMKLEVDSSTTNEMELVVDFTLYVFSVENQNSVFSVFELVFSSSENGIKYLLCSHHKPHTSEKPDELEKLILDIFDTYNYTGIEESMSTQNETQQSGQSETVTAKKGKTNRNQGIGNYRLEKVAASMHPRTVTAKKGKINRYRGFGNSRSEKVAASVYPRTVAAHIRIPEIMPYKEITQELLKPWKFVGEQRNFAKREIVKKHNITDFQLDDYNILDSQSISKLLPYPRLRRHIHPQSLKSYEDTDDVRYNEGLLRGKQTEHYMKKSR